MLPRSSAVGKLIRAQCKSQIAVCMKLKGFQRYFHFMIAILPLISNIFSSRGTTAQEVHKNKNCNHGVRPFCLRLHGSNQHLVLPLASTAINQDLSCSTLRRRIIPLRHRQHKRRRKSTIQLLSRILGESLCNPCTQRQRQCCAPVYVLIFEYD